MADEIVLEDLSIAKPLLFKTEASCGREKLCINLHAWI